MPRMLPTRRQNEPQTCLSHGLFRTLALVAASFAIGSTINVTKSLIDTNVIEPGRVLSQVTNSLALNPSIPGIVQSASRPRSTPGVRDETNGRGWIEPAQNELMRDRIRAIENRLKSLRTIPPTPVHPTVAARLAGGPATTSRAQNGAVQATIQPRTQKDLEYCRNQVFTAQQQPVTDEHINATCNDPRTNRFDVCHDLADFTGLTMDEVIVRIARMKQFHFEEEHLFWNPQTATALAWYYSTSQSYLFANAIHAARTGVLGRLKKDIHEPVLDYSGGVGNTVLYLAINRGFECQYFGIGMIEKAFTEFRVAKRGLQHMITFLSPWSERTGWRFDPIAALPRDGSLGAIVANDVLEHIPNYHIVVAAMVDSLKVGGVIIEQSPFATFPLKGTSTDTRIHVHNGGISMAEAMGDCMVFRDSDGHWEKVKS